MKHALVAGGSGFVGSHLVELLLTKGYKVTVVDNLVTGREKNIAHLLEKGVVWVDESINTALPFDDVFNEIYNLASPASPIDFDRMPIFILETVAQGHRNLLNYARSFNARILFASSSEVYGDPLIHPQVESYFGNCNPVGPRSCYDEAKRFGEALSVAYNQEYGLETRIARIFNTYGPRMRPNDGRILPNFFSQALSGDPITVHGDGKQTRSFCFVTDLVQGLYALMQSDEHRPTNIGNPKEVTVLEIAQQVKKLVKGDVKIEFTPARVEDPKRRKPDTTRIREATGWAPQVDLADGIRQTYEYFREELG